MEKVLFYLSGSSGVGKNTVIGKITESDPSIHYLVSYTTRGMRPGESECKPYHFISTDEFNKLVASRRIIEFDNYNGNYYGHCLDTILEELEDHRAVIKDLTIAGVEQALHIVREKLKVVTIFVTESKYIIKKRLISRGEPDYKARLREYDKEQRAMFKYDYVIKNKDLNLSTDAVRAIIDIETGTNSMLSNESCDKVRLSKIVRLENKLLKGKRVKPVKIGLRDGRLYILKGINTYLASLKCGKTVSKCLCFGPFDMKLDSHAQDEWEKVKNSFKMK